MSNTKAFPSGEGSRPYEYGMDLRDYFAAKAMQSLANAWAINKSYPIQDTELAECSYQVADAMMKARERCSDTK